MSSGAVFKLIANDGKADRIIMATQLINQRIKDVMCARRRAGLADITPTLVDLERTHILFVNAHFKPYAAIGFEYSKLNPQSGSSTLGGNVTFSIPQFGDFFHDMVAHVQLSSVQCVAQTAPTQPSASFPANAGNNVYSLVDAFGVRVGPAAAGYTGGTGGVAYQNLVRYCEYPGNRIFTTVKFSVNGNPLDEYTEKVSMMLQKFRLENNKEVVYNRLVGQENKITSHSAPRSATLTDLDGATPAGFVPTLEISRAATSVTNGFQTPKLVQPICDLWHKLKFWCNEDVRLSVPSVSLPHGQRFIECALAVQNQLVFEYCNLFLCTQTTVGDSVSLAYTPIFVQAGIQPLTIQLMELYINHIFMTPEVHDIYIKRIGFSLIRVYRMHIQTVNQSGSDNKQLSQLKWPIEYMMTGFRPQFALSAANTEQWRDWHRLTKVVTAKYSKPTIAYATGPGGTGTSTVNAIIPDSYALELPIVQTLGVQAHGIRIFEEWDRAFYTDYMPCHYGASNIRGPDDKGAHFINFCLFPGSYQPSGHVNLSRAREFNLYYTSSYISASTACDLIVVAIAINFLLISDGSAVLRYAT